MTRRSGSAVKAPALLETSRLLLRRPRQEDATGIFQRYASDADVTRFLGWPQHRSIDDARAFVSFSDAQWERHPVGPYLIWTRDDRRLLGGTGLECIAPAEAATGYVLAKDAWGQGYATEALTAMIEVAGRTGITRLSAFCHPDHAASWHVLEKCGFTRDTAWSGQMPFPSVGGGLPQDVWRYVREVGRS